MVHAAELVDLLLVFAAHFRLIAQRLLILLGKLCRIPVSLKDQPSSGTVLTIRRCIFMLGNWADEASAVRRAVSSRSTFLYSLHATESCENLEG